MDVCTFGQMPMSFHEFSKTGGCNDITLSVTEECNLRCKYCYLVHKNSNKKMLFDTAKVAVDYILSARNIYNCTSVVWNFIGGEPLLEIKLIDKITDYIIEQMYIKEHPWFDNFAFSMATNGLLYHTKPVQDYIEKNKDHLSITISIDGNKEKHDMQRVYPDGHGSYNDVIKNVPLWLSQFKDAMTKATFSREDLPYLKDSIIHLWNLGIKKIPANIIFEDVWQPGDARIFEEQLKGLADYVINNDIFLDPDYSVQFFSPTLGLPLTEEQKQHKYCGAGKMLAVDCDGNFFPCIRFTDFSMSNKKHGLQIGNINSGVIENKLRPFKQLSIEKINSQQCLDCEVASGCRTCVGFCYDESKDNSIFKRTIYNCEMHKANVRAVDYFWDKVSSKLDDSLNPRKIAKKRYQKYWGKYLLIYYSDKSIPHCLYDNTQRDRVITRKNFELAINFAQQNNMTPVVIGKHGNSNCLHISDTISENTEDILVSKDIKELFGEKIKAHTYILHIDKRNIHMLSNLIKIIFEKHDIYRINIALHDTEDFSKNDIALYKEQLKIIADLLTEDNKHSINIFDPVYHINNSSNFCESGINTFSVAPNGEIYVCPGIYFFDESLSIGHIDNMTIDDLNSFAEENFKNKKIKCPYLNKKLTGEYSIEPEILSCINNVEGEVIDYLRKQISKKNHE